MVSNTCPGLPTTGWAPELIKAQVTMIQHSWFFLIWMNLDSLRRKLELSLPKETNFVSISFSSLLDSRLSSEIVWRNLVHECLTIVYTIIEIIYSPSQLPLWLTNAMFVGGGTELLATLVSDIQKLDKDKQCKNTCTLCLDWWRVGARIIKN